MKINRSLLVCALLGLGCNRGVQELEPDKFYREQPPGTIESRHVLADRPGVLYNDVSVDIMDTTGQQDPLRLKEKKVERPNPTGISEPSSELAMGTTKPVGVPAPATQQTTAKASAGGYMTVGAVVVEINGQPIYADKVLSSLDAVFSAEAKQRDERAFRAFAEGEIRNQVYRFVNDELIYAQAQSKLDKPMMSFAEDLTMRWQEQQKTLAGGSIQAARAKFAAAGENFDEVIKEKYRQNVTAIYIEKFIRPRVQVTAQDMRHYYDKHLNTEFSEPDTVQYRLIKISVQKAGSRQDALKKIQDIAARAAKGEDFQSLATQLNDDPRLARANGLEAPIQRGALKNEKLADAVFSTPQGQLTGIIDDTDAFYIARVENVKGGRTQPFDDATVQKAIKDELTKQQMEPILAAERERRLSNGVMVPNPPLFDPVVEMAMQKYPQWAAK